MGNFSDFIRWRDWGPGKIPVFCTLLTYIVLANRDFSATSVVTFFLFILYAAIHSALGYVVNDWGDRSIDLLHGKRNAFEHLTHRQGIGALAALFTGAVLSGLPFATRTMFLPLWLMWLFFAVAYSVRPLRFKERGAWGLGISAIAQWTIPVLISFAAMERFGGFDMIVFALVSTISGATLEIGHQRHDRERDMSTGTNTFAARTGLAKLHSLYEKALLCDKLSLGVVLATVTVGVSPLMQSPALTIPTILLTALYLSLLTASLIEQSKSSARGEFEDPYYSSRRSAAKLLHETMPNLALPAYLLLMLIYFQPVYIFFLVAFLYWRIVLGRADWQWPLRAVRSWMERRTQS